MIRQVLLSTDKCGKYKLSEFSILIKEPVIKF